MAARIDIVGGGIGGLTLAVALEQRGLRVRVYEQAKRIRPVGAGINLACNAMQVYTKLGLAKAITAAGHSCTAMQVTDHRFRPLSTIDIRPFEKRFGVGNVAIHRAALLDILVSALKPGTLILDKEISSIENPERPIIHFKDGSQEAAAILVGADGLNSRVRASWQAGASIRTTKQFCWRGILRYRLPERFGHRLTEAWGRGRRFGMVGINAEEVYWFAVKDYTADDEKLTGIELADYYRNFSPLVRQFLIDTPNTHIHGTMLSDLAPLPAWSRGKIVLLGDAAHATTPNLGQGACQAIEDADVLAQLLPVLPAEQAFARYEVLRRKKANQVVKTSRALGQMAHWSQSWAAGLRNVIIRLTPASISARQSSFIYELAEV